MNTKESELRPFTFSSTWSLRTRRHRRHRSLSPRAKAQNSRSISNRRMMSSIWTWYHRSIHCWMWRRYGRRVNSTLRCCWRMRPISQCTFGVCVIFVCFLCVFYVCLCFSFIFCIWCLSQLFFVSYMKYEMLLNSLFLVENIYSKFSNISVIHQCLFNIAKQRSNWWDQIIPILYDPPLPPHLTSSQQISLRFSHRSILLYLLKMPALKQYRTQIAATLKKLDTKSDAIDASIRYADVCFFLTTFYVCVSRVSIVEHWKLNRLLFVCVCVCCVESRCCIAIKGTRSFQGGSSSEQWQHQWKW